MATTIPTKDIPTSRGQPQQQPLLLLRRSAFQSYSSLLASLIPHTLVDFFFICRRVVNPLIPASRPTSSRKYLRELSTTQQLLNLLPSPVDDMLPPNRFISVSIFLSSSWSLTTHIRILTDKGGQPMMLQGRTTNLIRTWDQASNRTGHVQACCDIHTSPTNT